MTKLKFKYAANPFYHYVGLAALGWGIGRLLIPLPAQGIASLVLAAICFAVGNFKKVV